MKTLKLSLIWLEIVVLGVIFLGGGLAQAQAPVGADEKAGGGASLQVTPLAGPANPLLGVAISRFTTEAGVDKLPPLKAHWSRREFPIDWRLVEPSEGQYNWAALADFEAEMLVAQAQQVEPIIEIQFTPAWAQKVPGWSCGAIRADKFEAFANFVEQLISRYGPATAYQVRYWQIGNEPDLAPEEIHPENWFGCWGDVNDPYFGGGHYAQMLQVVYPRIKAVDPTVQVMLGGLLLQCNPYRATVDADCTRPSRLQSGLFLEGVLRAGGGDYFDVVDVHAYAELRPDLPAQMHSIYGWSGGRGGTGLPEKVAFVRQVLAQYGYYDKPLMVGEIALKCEEPSSTCYDVGAAFIPRAYAEAHHWQVLGAIYYALVSEFKYKGLLLPDLTPKPAYTAYQFMSGQLAEADYLRPVEQYAGVSGHLFEQPDRRRIEILWSSDGTDQTITLPSNFQAAFDKLGTPLPPAANQLTVGWSPLYLLTEPLSTTLTAAGPATSLTFTDPDGLSTALHLPSGAVSDTISLILQPETAKAAGPLAFAGHAFELIAAQNGSPLDDFAFSQPLSVTVAYGAADVRVVSDETALSLRRWDGQAWVDAAQSCDPESGYSRDLDNRTVSLAICRTGKFALFGPTNAILLPATVRTY